MRCCNAAFSMTDGGDEDAEFLPVPWIGVGGIDAFAYPVDDNTVVVLPWQMEHRARDANMNAAAAYHQVMTYL